jgi:hypothetical protein
MPRVYSAGSEAKDSIEITLSLLFVSLSSAAEAFTGILNSKVNIDDIATDINIVSLLSNVI